MINTEENHVEKIIVKYEDGTESEILKGVVITDSDNEDESRNLVFEFVNTTGEGLANIIFGVVELGTKMGLFDGLEEDE